MNKWSYAKLMTSALLFLLIIQHVHVAIGTKDISMGRKLKHLKPKTESLKMMNPKKKNGFEYSDQVSSDLSRREVFVDMMASDYGGQKTRNPPKHN
ncbi:hypothetical protein ISN44_As08g001460 [Arabidopsis suecica]|uniref:Uncharacterized protein n=1 Tax=Arabidopsis suecica TaxID=45249 RepID=A0A8T2B398_ARASU|nr:hypothetical protein ISN44_As08g001460 [Arabidopsis suecica]